VAALCMLKRHNNLSTIRQDEAHRSKSKHDELSKHSNSARQKALLSGDAIT